MRKQIKYFTISLGILIGTHLCNPLGEVVLLFTLLGKLCNSSYNSETLHIVNHSWFLDLFTYFSHGMS